MIYIYIYIYMYVYIYIYVYINVFMFHMLHFRPRNPPRRAGPLPRRGLPVRNQPIRQHHKIAAPRPRKGLPVLPRLLKRYIYIYIYKFIIYILIGINASLFFSYQNLRIFYFYVEEKLNIFRAYLFINF